MAAEDMISWEGVDIGIMLTLEHMISVTVGLKDLLLVMVGVASRDWTSEGEGVCMTVKQMEVCVAIGAWDTEKTEQTILLLAFLTGLVKGGLVAVVAVGVGEGEKEGEHESKREAEEKG